MNHISETYNQILQPSADLVADIAALKGDILILGISGKMGPDLARLARRASDKADVDKKIIGAARFTEPGLRKELDSQGIITLQADLLNDEHLQALPEVGNVLYLAGTKFGTSGNESYTWAMNTYLPGRVAHKYKNARIVVFSTGNVYPLTPVFQGGADEQVIPQPTGEYAQSCLGRERIFQYWSAQHNTPILIYRLNYANDVSYGVVLEIARSVEKGEPIDLSMGHVNVIWQGDANEMALRSFQHCTAPAKILNIAGPETVSVRWLAQLFGSFFGRSPVFINEEKDTALLSNAAESFRLFGYPKFPLKNMCELLAAWIKSGGEIKNKPTHFQERKGQY